MKFAVTKNLASEHKLYVPDNQYNKLRLDIRYIIKHLKISFWVRLQPSVT